MVDHDIPEQVVSLVAEHIVSVEQLEILLTLRAEPKTRFGAKAISTALATSELSARARLSDLAQRGFLAVHEGEEPTYSYAPVSHRLEHAVDLLASTYAERRYTVIDLIFSKPIANLRVYADAFRFRKDD